MPFETQGKCVKKKIKMVEKKGDYDYSITMGYDIKSLEALIRKLNKKSLCRTLLIIVNP
jgi:hypothetical protein